MLSPIQNAQPTIGNPSWMVEPVPALTTPSPAYVIDLARIRANCEILAQIKHASGCHIAHAVKAFALPQTFPLLSDYLDGGCASGPWEARLVHESLGGKVLTYAPAYTAADIENLLSLTHLLDFNSITQWERFRAAVTAHPRFQAGEVRCGLRINPKCSTGRVRLYDPCAPGSRLGVPPDHLVGIDLDGISGLHFHTLCEQGSEDLATTLEAVDLHFGDLLRSEQITSLNMGGGHWITHHAYDRDLLVRLIEQTRRRYKLEEIWLEPGEATVHYAGTLTATVLDLSENSGIPIALLDVSATAHMPDVLEMPWRPEINLDEIPATESGPFHYRLGGTTCLAGDLIGDYAFHRPLEVGDRLEFLDMAPYSMVKTTFFNGVQHPAIVLRQEDGTLETVREFDYHDFRHRLG